MNGTHARPIVAKARWHTGMRTDPLGSLPILSGQSAAQRRAGPTGFASAQKTLPLVETQQVLR